jgi:site-specific DNA recombinase
MQYDPAMTYAGYSRLSISQDTSVSIDAQHAILERWAAAHGHEITLYTDDGFSGSKDIERPAYERMLAAIEAGQHDAVVVKSIDRLGRRLRAFIDLADSVRIITVEGGIDTDTPTGRMMLSLLSTFAEFEATQIGQRQATSQAYRRKAGRALGSPAFGYTNEHRADGAYRVLEETEARELRWVVEEILAGSSLRSIADDLNTRGIATKQGNLWSAATISQVVESPQIAGMRPSKGDVVRENGLPVIDEHLAIVSMTEWQRLQEARGKRQAFAPHGAQHERLLLHGLAVCGSCGRNMTRGSTTVKGKQYENYRCPTDVKTKCTGRPTISARMLDAYVEEQLAPLMSMPVMETVHAADDAAVQQRALLQHEIDALAASIGEASVADIGRIAERVSDLRQQLDLIVVDTVETVRPTGETLSHVWQTVPRLVVEQAIEQVIVYPATTKRAPAEARAQIVWRDYSSGL